MTALPQNTITPALSIVVPCYNEEEVMHELHRRCAASAREVVGDDFELVLVDDGSSDKTPTIMRELADSDGNVVAVFLARNHGHQKALSAGLQYARGNRVLILDADLQDPPELLGQMMVLMDQGNDVVFGQRVTREGETMTKKLTAALFYRLLRSLVETPLPVDAGDFRLVSRRVVDQLNTMPEEDRFIRGMVGWLGYRQVALPYERQSRLAGQTKYPMRKMVRLAVDAVTGFSTVPLRLATYLASLMAVLTIPMILYVLFRWATGETVQGWSSTMMVVLVASSIQLLTIGILGEYVGRLYLQSKRRPLFIVDEIYSGAKNDTEAAPAEAKGCDVENSAT